MKRETIKMQWKSPMYVLEKTWKEIYYEENVWKIVFDLIIPVYIPDVINDTTPKYINPKKDK